MKPDQTIGNWISRAGVVRVRNARNPLLWMIALVTPTSWLAVYFLRDDIIVKYFFTAIGSLPVFGATVAYFIFIFRDPDRLQSEEFVLKQQELSIIRSGRGEPKLVEVPDHTLPNIAEPDQPGIIEEKERS